MLEVSFNSPQCGWMSIGFSDGEKEFHTTTAHAPHEGALAQLLTILTALADTSSDETDFVLKWNRDPEAYDFHFYRELGNLILEIYEFPTGDRSEPCSLVYSYVGELGGSLRAFERTFDQLYADRDTDEFEFNWRQPFPLKEYEEFKRSLGRK
jgi:hypothetical protein